MKKLWIAILAMILPVLFCGAQAETSLGVQTGASYKQISLTASSNVATVLDYLEDYLDTELAYNLLLAEDLTNYSDKIEENRDRLAASNETDVQHWLSIYDAQPVSNGMLTARELAIQTYRNLVETRNEMDFFATKLSEYLTKDETLRGQILSGQYSPLEIDQLKGELAIVDREAEKYRASALSKLTGNSMSLNAVFDARKNLSTLDPNAPYCKSVQAVIELGSYILHREAEEISNRENRSNDAPYIRIIPKDEIAVTVLEPEADPEFPVHRGVEDMVVTLMAESKTNLGKPDPATAVSVKTDLDGIALFNLASLRSKGYEIGDNNRLRAFMTMDDPEGWYQRKDYGYSYFEGGESGYRLYVEEDTGEPYLVSLKFEDVDMTALGNGMYASNNDNTQYAIRGEVEMNGYTDRKVRVRLLDMGASTDNGASAQELFNAVVKPGEKTFEIKGDKYRWLKQNPASGEVALLAGHQLAMEVSIESAGEQGNVLRAPQVTPLQWSNLESDPLYDELKAQFPSDTMSNTTNGASTGTYLDAFVGSIAFRLPSQIPILGGSEISVSDLLSEKFLDKYPMLKKLKIQADLPNSLLIACNTSLIDPSKDDQGRVYASKAKRSIENRHKDEETKSTNIAQKVKQGFMDQEMANANGKWATTFSYSLSPFFQTKLSLLDKDSSGKGFVMSGDNTVGIIFDVSFDTTVYPVSFFYVNFNALFRIKAGVTLGLELDITTSGLQGVTWSDATGLTINFHVEFTLSAGAGVKGLAELGVRGAFWVDVTCYVTKGKTEDNDPLVGARVEGYVSALFFKWSKTIVEWPKKDKLPESTVPLLSSGSNERLNIEQINANLPRYGLKVIQAEHTLLGFWINRNVEPQRLEMYTIDYVDGLVYSFKDTVVYTVEKGNYLYDFDVCYDEYTGEADYLISYDKVEGVNFVVTEGPWEGGVEIGGDVSDYWKGDSEKDLTSCYQQAYRHNEGKTTAGYLKLIPGPIEKDESHWEPGTAQVTVNLSMDMPLFHPIIQTMNLSQDGITGKVPVRCGYYTVAGMEFIDDSRYHIHALTKLGESSTDVSKYKKQTMFEYFFTAASQISNYWLLGDPIFASETDPTQYVCNPMLVQYSLGDKDNNLYLLTATRNSSGGFEVKKTYMGLSDKMINSMSTPYFHMDNSYGRVFDKKYWFLLSDGEEMVSEADQNVPMHSGSLSLLCVQPQSWLNIDTYLYTFIYDYDLPGSGGNVDIMPMEWQDTAYFYWFVHTPASNSLTEDKVNTGVMASMLDPDRNILSPVFHMADMTGGFEADGRKLYMLRDEKGNEHLTIVYKADQQGYVQRGVTLPTNPSIAAFAPEFVAVGQGKSFDMYARIRNDGALVLREMQYVVEATAEKDRKKVLLQSGTINLSDPMYSSVVHLDYLQQDYPKLKGKSLKELNEALAQMNSINSYTTVGEHAVYRVPDNYDPFNGNLLHTVVTSTTDGEETNTVAGTAENYFFLPGNIATYKFSINGSATEALKGKQFLTMKINSYKFSFSMRDKCIQYEAVLSEDESRYNFYLLNENGERAKKLGDELDGSLSLFSSELPKKPIETSWVSENTGLNTDRNDALTTGNVRYLTMEQNDFDLNVVETSQGGVDYATFTLSNSAPEIAPDVTPRLIAKAVNRGQETPTGWSVTLKSSNIKDGFTRSITVPVNKIINGASFEEIKVYLVSTDSENPYDFMDQNPYNNEVTLSTLAPFRILRQPDDVVAVVDTDVQFSVQVEGGENCRYQWILAYPDGRKIQLEGATEATLSVPKVQLNQSGYQCACMITAADGRTICSRWAKLTVISEVPPTGDSTNPNLFAIGSVLCIAAMIFLLRKRKSRNA